MKKIALATMADGSRVLCCENSKGAVFFLSRTGRWCPVQVDAENRKTLFGP